MRFSVITVCFNSEKTINQCISSVFMQSIPDLEHIIIDGASSDSTVEIIRQRNLNHISLISEKDSGIYNAMNKGFDLASGDIVCFLNSDDYYIDDKVLSDVYRHFLQGKDFVYGDINMIDSDGKTKRKWIVGSASTDLRKSIQLPHPAFFIKRKILSTLNQPFDESLSISADLKQQFILSKLNLRGGYCSRPLVAMRLGGASTSSLNSLLVGWSETFISYRQLIGRGASIFLIRKILSKLKGL